MEGEAATLEAANVEKLQNILLCISEETFKDTEVYLRELLMVNPKFCLQFCMSVGRAALARPKSVRLLAQMVQCQNVKMQEEQGKELCNYFTDSVVKWWQDQARLKLIIHGIDIGVFDRETVVRNITPVFIKGPRTPNDDEQRTRLFIWFGHIVRGVDMDLYKKHREIVRNLIDFGKCSEKVMKVARSMMAYDKKGWEQHQALICDMYLPGTLEHALYTDDITELQIFLSKMDVVEERSYELSVEVSFFDHGWCWVPKNALEMSAYFGSLTCFRYFSLFEWVIDVGQLAVCAYLGGVNEIVRHIYSYADEVEAFAWTTLGKLFRRDILIWLWSKDLIAHIDMTFEQYDGYTILINAAAVNDVWLVVWALENGADVNKCVLDCYVLFMFICLLFTALSEMRV